MIYPEMELQFTLNKPIQQTSSWVAIAQQRFAGFINLYGCSVLGGNLLIKLWSITFVVCGCVENLAPKYKI